MGPFAEGARPTDPLLPVLRARARLPFHLPAHGQGRALPDPLRHLLRRAPGSWDCPELPDWGGPLLPDGAVAEAQRRCAALLGARGCWFGVNGASGLLQAALLAMAPPGARVLLPRNHHRSLLHGCLLGGLEPLLYALPFDPASGLWHPLPLDQLARVLRAALAEGPVAALVLVDPTYHGLRADLPALVALAHAHGLPVLVDQAHGVGEAVGAGADLVVLSPQKVAGGLAQGAALLSQGDRVAVEALTRSLLWLQTSSPSALLLASTAASLEQLHSASGRARRRQAEGRAQRLARALTREGWPLLATADPLRLPLHCGAFGVNGLRADAWLRQRGVVVELPEPAVILFCLGLAPPRGMERRLPGVLAALRDALGGDPLPPQSAPPVPLVAGLDLSIGVAWRAPSRSVPLERAVGRIAAEPLVPYPPGIPLLVPGERIDAARAVWLERQRRLWPGQITDTVRVVADTPGPDGDLCP
ncbi:MAG: aminotransferase class I/II-fold pyridoxal phosphate-dependent enzyme [Cyanobacteriota bacterium]|nr:aminotransferase class I/II-fold pyridoxal phosphate-dependent enzyme [Cyanobacteriota bacterium]